MNFKCIEILDAGRGDREYRFAVRVPNTDPAWFKLGREYALRGKSEALEPLTAEEHEAALLDYLRDCGGDELKRIGESIALIYGERTPEPEPTPISSAPSTPVGGARDLFGD